MLIPLAKQLNDANSDAQRPQEHHTPPKPSFKITSFKFREVNATEWQQLNPTGHDGKPMSTKGYRPQLVIIDDLIPE